MPPVADLLEVGDLRHPHLFVERDACRVGWGDAADGNVKSPASDFRKQRGVEFAAEPGVGYADHEQVGWPTSVAAKAWQTRRRRSAPAVRRFSACQAMKK